MARTVSALRDEAQNALERGKLDKAIELYAQLEEAEPKAPAWPKRIGETYRRAGKDDAAVAAFERAAEKYALEGFLVQAIAVCKLILQIDPDHSATQARLASWMPQPAEPILKPRPPDDDDDAVAELAPPKHRAVVRAPTAKPQIPQSARTQPLPAGLRQPQKPTHPDHTQPLPADLREPAKQPIVTPPRPVAPDPRRRSQPVAVITNDAPIDAPSEQRLPKPVPMRQSGVPRVPSQPMRSQPPAPEMPSEQRFPKPVPMRGKRDSQAATRESQLLSRPSTRGAWTESTDPQAARPRRPSRLTLRPDVAVRIEVEAPEPVRSKRPTPMQRPAEPSLPAIIIDKVPTIELPPGSGLDSIDLSALVPGTVPSLKADGTFSGIHVLLDGDLELSLDDAEPIEPGPSPTARHALMTTPLFSQMPAALLEMLIGRMTLIVLEPGQVLFREGETGTELFVISEGEVAVESGGNRLATLGPSAFFGEIALVTDLPRSATITAITRTELLAIDRDVIRDAAAAHSEVISVLLAFVRDRLIHRITKTSELFAPFTEGERESLSARFELVEVVPDAVLITQGERADGLYLVVAGKVEVWRDGEAPLATLGSGDVFGELSLLSNSGSIANVRSVSRVLALRMPASTFHEVIMTHPQVLAYLGELAERRTPRDGGDDFVDLHVDLLV